MLSQRRRDKFSKIGGMNARIVLSWVDLCLRAGYRVVLLPPVRLERRWCCWSVLERRTATAAAATDTCCLIMFPARANDARALPYTGVCRRRWFTHPQIALPRCIWRLPGSGAIKFSTHLTQSSDVAYWNINPLIAAAAATTPWAAIVVCGK